MENSRLIAIVSHITIIGWVIAIIMYQNDKSDFAKFYLRQSLGIFIIAFLASFIKFLGMLIGLVCLILLILSAIDAVNNKKSPTPFIGQFFQQFLSFIN